MESDIHMKKLLQLAPEILEHILAYLKPIDLISFGRTCSQANTFISPENQLLWRASFLQAFDDPRIVWEALLPTARALNAKVEAQWDWYTEVSKRYSALRAVTAHNPLGRRANYEENVAALVDMINTATESSESLNLPLLLSVFGSSKSAELFVHDFHPDMESPSLPADPHASSGRPFTRSMISNQYVSESSSRFHILHGITERERTSRIAKGSARALVYDWSLTGPSADFGPFQQDKSGEINWKVLEAIYSVIVRNFELVTQRKIQLPQGFAHNIPQPLSSFIKAKDWAHVEGSWLGTYSFLDYTDLFHYNIAYRPGPRPPLDDHVEACGDLMRLKLKLNDELYDDERLASDLPICEDLPKLYFSGTSQGHDTHNHHAVISVRGFVALTPDGRRARWRFVIR